MSTRQTMQDASEPTRVLSEVRYMVQVIMVEMRSGKNKPKQVHVVGSTAPMERREASMVASAAALAMKLARGE